MDKLLFPCNYCDKWFPSIPKVKEHQNKEHSELIKYHLVKEE